MASKVGSGATVKSVDETALAAEAGPSFRKLMQTRGPPAEELGLTAKSLTEDQILDATIPHPILVNRLRVVNPRGVKPSRLSEVVFDLLYRRPQSLAKGDGEVVDLSARP